MQHHHERPTSERGGVVVLDFGGQYTQLIARRIREQQVFSSILPCTTTLDEIRKLEPTGIVLSGGPSSVYDPQAPRCDPAVLSLGIPVLGICYGMQWLTHQLGGKVEPAARREYGSAVLNIDSAAHQSELFAEFPNSLRIWNSHGDHVVGLPPGFRTVGRTQNAVAAVEDPQRKIYAVEFHPEVRHTDRGTEILRNFLFRICKAKPKWSGAAFIEAWLPGYDRRSQLHCHLSWHLALFELARGNGERARAIYLDNIRPSTAQAVPMLVLADAASFLWRWRYYGVAPSLEQEWAEVAAHAQRHFPRASLAFADVHAALVEAAIGNDNSVCDRIAGLESLTRDGRLPPGKVAPTLCAGAAALGRGDNAEAARLLEAALDDLPRIGGSHAQREVFEDSLIVAYLRSGQSAGAARLLRSRMERRPSARDEDWLARCERHAAAV